MFICVPIHVHYGNNRNDKQTIQGAQKDFFDMADKGQKVVIKRGSKQAYVLTPVSRGDLYFTSDMIERIKESHQQIKDGKGIVLKTKDELDAYFNSL